jgi:CDP-diacylglycerol--serine O-phosphatidyltransferase
VRRRPAALRRRRWSDLRERRRQTVFLLPGLLTTGNLLCGFYTIVLTLDAQYHWAAIVIFVAMVMDILDGKVARLTRTTTQFGIEYDSLADVISFGVAPAVLLYAWALTQLGHIGPGAGRIGAGAAFLYVLCAALRLARFNVLTGVTDRRYFIGLPSPGGAGAVASMVIFFGPVQFGRVELFALACATYLLAFLMVSNIRYYSFKQLDFAKRHPYGVLLVAALGILVVITYREEFPFVAFGTYALSGPVRRLLLRKREPAPPRVLRETPSGPAPDRGPGH